MALEFLLPDQILWNSLQSQLQLEQIRLTILRQGNPETHDYPMRISYAFCNELKKQIAEVEARALSAVQQPQTNN